MTTYQIRTVSSPSHTTAIEGCIDALARAFENDAAARWVWPDDQVYRAWFPKFVRAFGGPAFSDHSAYFLDDYAGAALWLPPGVHPDDEALGELLEKSVPAEELSGVLSVFDQMGAYHPREAHWHLPLIGVRPDHQGKGYGSALMEPVLDQCDREGKVAYLEATGPSNVRLYQRLGFEVIGSISAGPSAVISPMVREPRRR
jgi:GNAT superfamily N-acetyltransferase